MPATDADGGAQSGCARGAARHRRGGGGGGAQRARCACPPPGRVGASSALRSSSGGRRLARRDAAPPAPARCASRAAPAELHAGRVVVVPAALSSEVFRVRAHLIHAGTQILAGAPRSRQPRGAVGAPPRWSPSRLSAARARITSASTPRGSTPTPRASCRRRLREASSKRSRQRRARPSHGRPRARSLERGRNATAPRVARAPKARTWSSGERTTDATTRGSLALARRILPGRAQRALDISISGAGVRRGGGRSPARFGHRRSTPTSAPRVHHAAVGAGAELVGISSSLPSRRARAEALRRPREEVRGAPQRFERRRARGRGRSWRSACVKPTRRAAQRARRHGGLRSLAVARRRACRPRARRASLGLPAASAPTRAWRPGRLRHGVRRLLPRRPASAAAIVRERHRPGPAHGGVACRVSGFSSGEWRRASAALPRVAPSALPSRLHALHVAKRRTSRVWSRNRSARGVRLARRPRPTAVTAPVCPPPHRAPSPASVPLAFDGAAVAAARRLLQARTSAVSDGARPTWRTRATSPAGSARPCPWRGSPIPARARTRAPTRERLGVGWKLLARAPPPRRGSARAGHQRSRAARARARRRRAAGSAPPGSARSAPDGRLRCRVVRARRCLLVHPLDRVSAPPLDPASRSAAPPCRGRAPDAGSRGGGLLVRRWSTRRRPRACAGDCEPLAQLTYFSTVTLVRAPARRRRYDHGVHLPSRAFSAFLAAPDRAAERSSRGRAASSSSRSASCGRDLAPSRGAEPSDGHALGPFARRRDARRRRSPRKSPLRRRARCLGPLLTRTRQPAHAVTRAASSAP